MTQATGEQKKADLKTFECKPEEIALILRVRQLQNEDEVRTTVLHLHPLKLSVVGKPEHLYPREEQ